MSLSIIHHPHPTLRFKSQPIVRVDKQLQAIAAEMLELMYQKEGVGLAANQVDLPLRMFVANPAGVRGEGQELVLINPVLDRPKGSEEDREGCLSLPGIYGQVRRPKSVRLRAYTIDGGEVDQVVDGFMGRVVQHEIDHLDGMMFFDRMSPEAMREIQHDLLEFDVAYKSRRDAGEYEDSVVTASRGEWLKQYA